MLSGANIRWIEKMMFTHTFRTNLLIKVLLIVFPLICRPLLWIVFIWKILFGCGYGKSVSCLSVDKKFSTSWLDRSKTSDTCRSFDFLSKPNKKTKSSEIVNLKAIKFYRNKCLICWTHTFCASNVLLSFVFLFRTVIKYTSFSLFISVARSVTFPLILMYFVSFAFHWYSILYIWATMRWENTREYS